MMTVQWAHNTEYNSTAALWTKSAQAQMHLLSMWEFLQRGAACTNEALTYASHFCDSVPDHNTNAPFKMCATCMITAKRMHEKKSEEMRGKSFLDHFRFLALHLIFQPQYLQDSQILFSILCFTAIY